MMKGYWLRKKKEKKKKGLEKDDGLLTSINWMLS
jgi:hypothetical protein